MKPLNRPMFRMGGPIKEGIMDGIEEPRQGFKTGTPPSFFGLRFKEPINFSNLFKSPETIKNEKQQKLSSIFSPDYSMSDYGKVPIIRNELIASQSDMVPNQKIELVDENTISTNDIDPFANLKVPGAESKMSSTEAQDFAFDTSTGGGGDPNPTYISKMQEGMLKRGTPGGDADIMIPPKKPITPAKDVDEKRLREILGYDRAVKRGNYSLIEAIRKGLTEGGVQGALNAAFAAGDTAYKDAEKLRQVADLKQYERELELKDYDKKRKDALEDKITLLKEKQKLDPDKQAKGIVEKTMQYLIKIGVDETEALKIATKQEPTINAQVLKVQKSSGLPAITADVLDVSGGVYYGNEYKGRTSSTVDESTLTDGWYLVDGSYFIEVDKGKFDLESRSVTFPVRG
tara:strand:- start:1301 stop:2506 length:1206 start_codon:yes stop_codon:yes gene_type:complete